MIYPHPSHLPNLRNSCNTQSVLSFPSLSRSLSLPLSVLESTDDPLDVRCRAIEESLGGDPDDRVVGEREETPWLGKERRYQPPVYVRAIS
jgi:hypothetical protein